MHEVGEKVLVELDQLSKSFSGTKVLQRVSTKIGAGHIVGLVGPNSSGKSTLLRHLIGMYLPTRGRCLTFGVDARDLTPNQLARIGYVHQETQLMNWMSGRELVNYLAAHYATWNKALELRLADLFGLNLKQKVGLMSPGNRQKLSILLAVAFEPELLILDEPASALDPTARRQFLELLIDLLAEGGKTVLISSHHLNDIEKIVDHIMVLEEGRLLKDCAFDQLQEGYVKLELIKLEGELPPTLPFSQVFFKEQRGGHALVTMKRTDLSHEEIAARLQCQVVQHALSFEEIYPLILEEAKLSVNAYA